MASKILTYDLGIPEASQSYQNLIKAIERRFPDSIRPLKSFWVLNTTLSCKQIKEYLQPYLDSNDKLFIVDCPLTTWSSQGLTAQDLRWLHAH